MKSFFYLITLTILISIIAIACGSQAMNNIGAIEDPAAEVADLIIRNGKFYTVNVGQQWAEAVAIKEGKLLYVGPEQDVEAYLGPDTEIMDLGGRMVMPGIHDVHQHPLEAGSEVGGTCLLRAGTPPELYINLLRRCAPNQVGTHWVLGFGHSVDDLFNSERLPLDILDEAIPDRPALMLEETSHSAWANSLALEEAGFDADSPDPPGGILDRDPETGELTGILFENAGNMLMELAFAPNAELDELNYEGLLYSLGELAKNGITSVVDARTYWQRDHQKAWRRALEEGTLTARAVLGAWAYPHMEDDEQLAQLLTMYDNDSDSLLRVTQVKMYSDGIIINGSAALLEPYEEDLLGLPGNVGMNYFDEARLTRYVTELDKAGFDLHIHAIGDRGAREALNAIEAAQIANDNRAGRHRLTHVEMVHEEDRGRFAELGVIADFQVAGHFTLPGHAEQVADLVGDRAFDMVPVRSIYDTGATITLSSDWDVSELSPFIGIQNALQRDAQSLPDLHTVLQAYTISGAYLMRQEDRTGSLEVGKWADLIVLDQNLFEIGVDQIKQTNVLLTMLGGEVVHESQDFYAENDLAQATATSIATTPPIANVTTATPSATTQTVVNVATATPQPSATPADELVDQPTDQPIDQLRARLYLPFIARGGKK